jgi:hypothetical protein
MDHPRTTLEWANLYASLGWSVVPVRPGEKLPAVHWMAYQRQPATASELHGWFAVGGYGIGLVQGARPNCITLDFDGDQGHETLASLEQRFGALPPTVRAITPGGGVHVILRHPGKNVPTRKNLLPGFDVRGDGGFIVAHPSRHANGRTYEWDVDNHPEDVVLADCPAWVADIICGDAPSGEGASVPVQMAQAPGPLGMAVERVVDGREAYMRDTILAVLIDLRERLGRTPTEAELTAEAWPQYERKVDFSRPGRGAAEFAAKVRYTLARAAKGVIRGVPADGDAVGLPATTHDWEGDGGPLAGSAEKPKAKKDIQVLSLQELEALPPIEYLVEGLIPEEGVVVPYGPPKVGKTFVVLSMALHVAAGMAWMGKKVRQAGVVYVAGEGARGVALRSKVMRSRYGIPDNIPFWVIPHRINLREAGMVAKLTAAIREVVLDEPIGLIIFDTLPRMMPGADENSAQDMGLVVAACDDVKETFKASVMAVMHTGKNVDQGIRGSNAVLGALDASLLVQAAGEKVIRVKNEDQKDGETAPDMLFRLEEVSIGLGRSSLVPVPLDGPQPASAPQQLSLVDQIARALGQHKARLPTKALAEALGMTSGNGRSELAKAIPIAPLTVETVIDGQRVRLWKFVDGDKKTSPTLFVREDIS